MKKFKKIMAVLVAAMMIMATMVPAWAAANTTPNYTTPPQGSAKGTLESSKAVITIDNAKANETYTAYRLFELASFFDNVPETGAHEANTEWYSYVIDETTGWFTFLTTYGPAGTTGVKYAVSDATGADSSNAYFVYSNEKVTIGSNSNYHIIKSTANFTGALDDTSNGSVRPNEGVTALPDYVSGTNKKVQDFAQEALKYAEANPGTITAIKSGSVASDGTLNLLTTTDDQKIGYYLIGSTMGTLVALDTTNTTVTVHEKNDEPKIEKFVRSKDGTVWQKNVDADIDDVVRFKTEITAEQGVKNYKLHDVMEKGLTLTETLWTIAGDEADGFKVTLVRTVGTGDDAVTTTYNILGDTGEQTVSGNAVSATNWTLKTGATNGTNGYLPDGCDFELTFHDADLNEFGNDKVTFLARNAAGGQNSWDYIDIKDGDIIIVEYSAKLNNNATIYGKAETRTAGDLTEIKYTDNTTKLDDAFQVKRDYQNTPQRNTNYTILTYGAKSHTTSSKATVTTYQYDIVKTTADKTSNVFDMLDTAKFSMYKVEPVTLGEGESADITIGTNTYNYVTDMSNKALSFSSSGSVYTYAGDTTTKAKTAGTLDDSQKLTSAKTAINVRGLEAGYYMIKEDVAPIGYDKLAWPIVVEITGRSDETTWDSETNEGTLNISVLNNNSTTSDLNGYTLTNKPWEASVTDGKYSAASNPGGVQIINATGTELPSTGGMGTTVLYIVGGMLVILAGAYLLFSRKKTA